MTDATILALDSLRDLSMLKWYVVPLLSFTFYIYTREIKEARQTQDPGDPGHVVLGRRLCRLQCLY